MSLSHPAPLSALDYDRAAEDYLRSLPLEHFMEATPQATQREITVESLALLRTRRGGIQYFNELLLQYLYEGKLRQVVPDNMLILTDEASQARTNYAVELEPVPPFLVLEYVSPASERKDYEESFRKYERELKVPNCLLFHPQQQDLRVYRHDGEQYVRLEPDADGRCLIAELDLQVGLLDHWVRFWYQGELLELPAELQHLLDQQAAKLKAQAEQLTAQGEQLTAQADQLTAQGEQLSTQADQLTAQGEQLSTQADQLTAQGEQLSTQADQLTAQGEQLSTQADQLTAQGEQLSTQADQLTAQGEQLSTQAEHIGQLKNRMASLTEQAQQMLDLLRRQVVERAQQAGRQDILSQLPAMNDVGQLAQWLAELH